MQHILMNRGSLEGYQKGYYDTVPPCFYHYSFREPMMDTMVDRHIWTPCLGLAHRFSTELEAWEFAKATWGLKFTNEQYLVVAAHKDALDRSYQSHELITETRFSNG